MEIRNDYRNVFRGGFAEEGEFIVGKAGNHEKVIIEKAILRNDKARH
jgi:hypothetical protein